MLKFDLNVCVAEASFSSYSPRLPEVSDSVCNAAI